MRGGRSRLLSLRACRPVTSPPFCPTAGQLGSNRPSQLIDSALTADAGHMPRSSGPAQPPPAAAESPAAAAVGPPPADCQPTGEGGEDGQREGGMLRRLLSKGGSGRKLKRVQTQ